MTLLLVIVGGAVGAALRFLTDRWVQSRHASAFPWGTWTVNVVGSFVLGVVVAGTSGWWPTLAGTGFCGALTTFSTFGFESVRLAQDDDRATALANVAGSLTAGLVAVCLGWWLGSAL